MYNRLESISYPNTLLTKNNGKQIKRKKKEWERKGSRNIETSLEEEGDSAIDLISASLHWRGVGPVLIECSVCWQVGILAGRQEGWRKSDIENETDRARVCVRCGRDIGLASTVPLRPCTCHFRWPCHSAASSSSSSFSDPFLPTSHAASRKRPIQNTF